MSDFEPLSTLMASGPMPIEEVIRIGRDAAAALTSVHGELWPSALTVSDAEVGVVPPVGADRSRYGQYAAPERLLGKPATVEADVFSLGAILFHALVGRPPFRGDTPTEVMLAVCSDAPLDVRSFRADVPAELVAVITRCLARDPVQRYPSPAVLRDALDRIRVRDAFPGKRILIADDDAPVRDFHTQIAAQVGVDADVVASGRDAIAAMKSRRYDVALLDLNMPRLSGWEVLDFLRTRKDIRPSRLFIITGFSGQHISEADRDLVTAVLYKPVAADELRSLLTQCLRGAAIDVASILRFTAHRAPVGV
jgi:CheY-like chemotaxis protein